MPSAMSVRGGGLLRASGLTGPAGVQQRGGDAGTVVPALGRPTRRVSHSTTSVSEWDCLDESGRAEMPVCAIRNGHVTEDLVRDQSVGLSFFGFGGLAS